MTLRAHNVAGRQPGDYDVRRRTPEDWAELVHGVVSTDALLNRDKRRCRICGLDRPKNHDGEFCDEACEWLAKNDGPMKKTISCLYCGNDLSDRPRRPTFCNDLCRHRHRRDVAATAKTA